MSSVDCVITQLTTGPWMESVPVRRLLTLPENRVPRESDAVPAIGDTVLLPTEPTGQDDCFKVIAREWNFTGGRNTVELTVTLVQEPIRDSDPRGRPSLMSDRE